MAHTPDSLLILLSLLILGVFWALLLFLLGISTSSGGGGTALLSCPAGECATSLFTGFKTCPAGPAPVLADPSSEVCSQPTSCTSPSLPFAVLPNGSVNLQGLCAPGTVCRCVDTPQCADYVLSVFQTQDGNPYQPTAGQRLKFPQSTVYPTSSGASSRPPIRFSDPAATFCSIPLAWISLAVPGCPVSGAIPTPEELLTCMNLPQKGVGNPCLAGTLAFLPSDPETFSELAIFTTPLACVAADPTTCPVGSFNVWDDRSGGLVCREAHLSLPT